MLGRPSKAQNITTMRPFSRRCAIVSMPLPVRSRYATRCPSRTTNDPAMPLGEQFTSPSPARGAVATKNIGCAVIHAASLSSIDSST